MLNSLPYEIFLHIIETIYNLKHYNLIYIQRLLITNKELYYNSYDISKDMLSNIIPKKHIIYYSQPFFKKSDWWIKLLHFYTINICNCCNSESINSYCLICNRIKPIK